MERLKQRIETADNALTTLEQVLLIDQPSSIERDASIQRFEYSFEAQWKLAKQYLRDFEGIDSGSPKGVIRSCHEAGVLNEEETIKALEMVDDRNLTSHTYNEELAEEIYKRLAGYSTLLRKWWRSIKERVC
jgi:nucleotidyltransferase substrate binding protein (TIGR01987 family)